MYAKVRVFSLSVQNWHTVRHIDGLLVPRIPNTGGKTLKYWAKPFTCPQGKRTQGKWIRIDIRKTFLGEGKLFYHNRSKDVKVGQLRSSFRTGILERQIEEGYANGPCPWRRGWNFLLEVIDDTQAFGYDSVYNGRLRINVRFLVFVSLGYPPKRKSEFLKEVVEEAMVGKR